MKSWVGFGGSKSANLTGVLREFLARSLHKLQFQNQNIIFFCVCERDSCTLSGPCERDGHPFLIITPPCIAVLIAGLSCNDAQSANLPKKNVGWHVQQICRLSFFSPAPGKSILEMQGLHETALRTMQHSHFRHPNWSLLG